MSELISLCRQISFESHKNESPSSLVNRSCPFACYDDDNNEPGKIIIRYHTPVWAHVRCSNLKCVYRPFSVKNPIDLIELFNSSSGDPELKEKAVESFERLMEEEKDLVNQEDFAEAMAAELNKSAFLHDESDMEAEDAENENLSSLPGQSRDSRLRKIFEAHYRNCARDLQWYSPKKADERALSEGPVELVYFGPSSNSKVNFFSSKAAKKRKFSWKTVALNLFGTSQEPPYKRARVLAIKALLMLSNQAPSLVEKVKTPQMNDESNAEKEFTNSKDKKKSGTEKNGSSQPVLSNLRPSLVKKAKKAKIPQMNDESNTEKIIKNSPKKRGAKKNGTSQLMLSNQEEPSLVEEAQIPQMNDKSNAEKVNKNSTKRRNTKKNSTSQLMLTNQEPGLVEEAQIPQMNDNSSAEKVNKNSTKRRSVKKNSNSLLMLTNQEPGLVEEAQMPQMNDNSNAEKVNKNSTKRRNVKKNSTSQLMLINQEPGLVEEAQMPQMNDDSNAENVNKNSKKKRSVRKNSTSLLMLTNQEPGLVEEAQMPQMNDDSNAEKVKKNPTKRRSVKKNSTSLLMLTNQEPGLVEEAQMPQMNDDSNAEKLNKNSTKKRRVGTRKSTKKSCQKRTTSSTKSPKASPSKASKPINIPINKLSTSSIIVTKVPRKGLESHLGLGPSQPQIHPKPVHRALLRLGKDVQSQIIVSLWKVPAKEDTQTSTARTLRQRISL